MGLPNYFLIKSSGQYYRMSQQLIIISKGCFFLGHHVVENIQCYFAFWLFHFLSSLYWYDHEINELFWFLSFICSTTSAHQSNSLAWKPFLLFLSYLGFQSQRQLYIHKCLFVSLLVSLQNPSTAWNHHPSSFIILHSFILH